MKSLIKELEEIRDAYQNKFTFKDLYHFFNMKSLLPWPVLLLAFLCGSGVFAHYALISPNWKASVAVGIMIFAFVLLNASLTVWVGIRKRREVCEKITWMVNLIEDAHDNTTAHELYTEFVDSISCSESAELLDFPSHSFTMMYHRNADSPVPFPTSLLSTGDTIALHSGQTSPCQAVCAHDGCINLERGEVFFADKLDDSHLAIEAEETLFKFTIVRSPVVDSVQVCLDKCSSFNSMFNRPKLMLTRNRETMLFHHLCVVIPLMCVVTAGSIAAWYILISWSMSLFIEYESLNSWFEVFFISLVLVILPVLPIICPVIWTLVYLVGEAQTLAEGLKTKSKVNSISKKPAVSPLVLSPTRSYSFDEMLLTSSHKDGTSNWFNLLVSLVHGMRNLFVLNAATFDSLGSLTALCCINKEGILSWCDPVPEKVCFLRDNEDDASESGDEEPSEQSLIRRNSSLTQTSRIEVLSLSRNAHTVNLNKLQFDDPDWSQHIASLKPIGMNILVNSLLQVDPNKLSTLPDCPHKFLHQLIEHLKKDIQLGSAKTGGSRDKFFSHCKQLYYIASRLKLTPPDPECSCPNVLVFVPNHETKGSNLQLPCNTTGMRQKGIEVWEAVQLQKRRGLRVDDDTIHLQSGLKSLAALIGFEQDTSLLFSTKLVLSGYKKLATYSHQKKSSTSINPPNDIAPNRQSLGYIHAVVMSMYPATDQDFLLTCGCGDVVIELCTHYWDGKCVKKLDSVSRRKIVDFSHRSAIVGNCVAFSFQPISSKFKERSSTIVNMDDESQSSFPTRQIFLGAVALQYHPRGNVYRLIEALESAAIRFVHFSPEDEFKSRVFAEKMGLEAGWNCHISLAPCHQGDRLASTEATRSESECQEDDDLSANLLTKSPQTPVSESSFSDTAFHHQNRAKLPRGIDNIVPHIENVDNVPLLVPLFTDCQQQCMREMISIMQRYDEVVCCVGSSECIDNMQVFAQADVGIAIQPVLTHFCADETPLSTTSPPAESHVRSGSKFPSDGNCELSSTRLMSLARALNTFPCSITLNADDNLALLYNMIKQARHFLFLTTIALTFLMKSLAALSIIQLICHLLHLPRIFTSLDVLWLAYFIAPSLSLSLLASPRDSDLMTWASLKNSSRRSSLRLARANIKRFMSKFLPSCAVVVLLYLIQLLSACSHVQDQINNSTNASSLNVRCYPYFSVKMNSTAMNETKFVIQSFIYNQRIIAQQICCCAYVFYISIISSGYVHRWKGLRHNSPFSNRCWGITIIIIWIMQAIYSSIISSTSLYTDHTVFQRSFFPANAYTTLLWTLFFVWPLPLLLINETAKHYEIKVWTRNQKRARLAFGTKLGMNSPF